MLVKVKLPNLRAKSIYFRMLGRKQILNFRPGFNVIIGPNATGKTSLLKFIESGVKCKTGRFDSFSTADCDYHGSVITDGVTNVLWYNPSLYSKAAMSNEFKTNGLDVSTFINTVVFRQSEAECAGRYFTEFFNMNKERLAQNCLLLVDEPELHNDLHTLELLLSVFNNWIQYAGVQIVATTHHPLVLSSATNVIELKENYRQEFVDSWHKCLAKL